MKRITAIAILALGATALTAQAQTFKKTRMVDAKGKEMPADLQFDGSSKVLSVKVMSATVADVPYANVDKLSYEKASRRRVKEGAIVMIASLGVGGVVMLTKSKSHWLYVDYRDAGGATKNVTLKLDKGEYERVLQTAREQTGKSVETLSAQKGDGPKGKKPKA